MRAFAVYAIARVERARAGGERGPNKGRLATAKERTPVASPQSINTDRVNGSCACCVGASLRDALSSRRCCGQAARGQQAGIEQALACLYARFGRHCFQQSKSVARRNTVLCLQPCFSVNETAGDCFVAGRQPATYRSTASWTCAKGRTCFGFRAVRCRFTVCLSSANCSALDPIPTHPSHWRPGEGAGPPPVQQSKASGVQKAGKSRVCMRLRAATHPPEEAAAVGLAASHSAG
eukprot:359879-Chlamydomonas_euryale.AAC.1